MTASPTGAPGSAAGGREAELRFEVGDLSPTPLMHGTVGGEPIWMHVDTGASRHTVAGWVARRGGIAKGATGISFRDHQGVGMTAERADATMVVIDRWGRLPPGPLFVTEEDERLPPARAGIGALISPQQLVVDRPIVIDLRRKELRETSEEEAAHLLSFLTRQLTPHARPCGGVFLVEATFDGHRARMMIDTGAARTDLFTRSEAGAALWPRSRASSSRHYSLSGEMAPARVVPHAALRAGDVSVSVDVVLHENVRPSPCEEDGVIGVDVLRSCVLVLSSRDDLRIRCS